ncbi:phospholipid phosphatase 1 [Nilaparvata lugens]|uniref:phospholipid phosphatase 1 n=1 Tax=Nilaparvata lugens TaxID=108931 RepID=UPI00193DF2E7|nr:phospholipid phosphatase 1 [Nilaparvata lugens]
MRNQCSVLLCVLLKEVESTSKVNLQGSSSMEEASKETKCHDNPAFTISVIDISATDLQECSRQPRTSRQVTNSTVTSRRGSRRCHHRDSATLADSMTMDSRTPRCNLLAEVLIVCTVFTTLLLMEFGLLPDLQNVGFYCDDPKIKYKFRGDTIGIKTLLGVTIFLPLAVISLVEWGCHGAEGYAKRGGGRWAWMTQTLRWYWEYLSGLLIVFFLADIAKLLVGEPRPHFLDTCQPHQAINCSSGYIAKYECTNVDLSFWRVKDASRSFPSGHAAISVYLFTFTAWFLERRMSGVGRIVVAWLQVLVCVWALVCSLTRITDRRHHWWDVLAGSVLGVLVGMYTVRTFCCDFRLSVYRSHSVSAKQLEGKVSGRQLYGGNTSARRLLNSTSSYSAEPVSRERDTADLSIT